MDDRCRRDGLEGVDVVPAGEEEGRDAIAGLARIVDRHAVEEIQLGGMRMPFWWLGDFGYVVMLVWC